MDQSVNVSEPRRKIMSEALAYQPDESPKTGADLIESITSLVGIKTTMVAALLNVTERTLSNWSEIPVTKDAGSAKFQRLIALYDFTLKAAEAGIKGKAIMNLLDEPIPGEPEEKSLLYYIIDEPDNNLLAVVADKIIKQF